MRQLQRDSKRRKRRRRLLLNNRDGNVSHNAECYPTNACSDFGCLFPHSFVADCIKIVMAL